MKKFTYKVTVKPDPEMFGKKSRAMMDIYSPIHRKMMRYSGYATATPAEAIQSLFTELEPLKEQHMLKI